VRINTDDIVLRDLGARLPNLSELKLNSSNVLSFRDLGTSFASLTVLWLARSNVHELDGKAHRRLYHSRVIKKKKLDGEYPESRWRGQTRPEPAARNPKPETASGSSVHQLDAGYPETHV